MAGSDSAGAALKNEYNDAVPTTTWWKVMRAKRSKDGEKMGIQKDPKQSVYAT